MAYTYDMYKLAMQIIVSILFIAPLSSAAAIYKKQDAAGNWYFSDMSTETKPEPLTLPSINSSLAKPDSFEPATSVPNIPEIQLQSSYEIVITSPEDNETLAMGLDILTVDCQIKPELQTGAIAYLLVDNLESEAKLNNKQFVAKALERGDHVLQVKIKTLSNQIFLSPSILIHQLRPVVKK